MYISAVKFFCDLCAFLGSCTGNICENDGIAGEQMRQFICNERINAGILQSDGIEHARGRFRDARGEIARALCTGCAFGCDAAQKRKRIIFLIFPAVAEHAGRGNDGVFQRQITDFYLQISHYQTTSSALNTGPFLQTCKNCVSPF